MKTKHLLLILLALLTSIGVSAYTFTVDGIYYKILSETDKTVAVVNNMRYNSIVPAVMRAMLLSQTRSHMQASRTM